MLCESLQIVFWTVSFVCRIYPRRTCTYAHIYTRTHSSQICIFIVHMRSIRQRDESRIVFLAHVNIVCGLSDISGWIYHTVAIHRSASRYISYKNNTRSNANMRKCSRSLYPLFVKNVIYTRYLFSQTLFVVFVEIIHFHTNICHIDLLNSILLNVIAFLYFISKLFILLTERSVGRLLLSIDPTWKKNKIYLKLENITKFYEI